MKLLNLHAIGNLVLWTRFKLKFKNNCFITSSSYKVFSACNIWRKSYRLFSVFIYILRNYRPPLILHLNITAMARYLRYSIRVNDFTRKSTFYCSRYFDKDHPRDVKKTNYLWSRVYTHLQQLMPKLTSPPLLRRVHLALSVILLGEIQKVMDLKPELRACVIIGRDLFLRFRV